jgi:hypothetical protein
VGGIFGAVYQGDGSTCDAVDCPFVWCPGQGGCCAAHRSPGCEDEACCALVCEADLFCCMISWDSACVRSAEMLCGCGRLGDFDGNGTVDLADHGIFVEHLFSGPLP